MQHDTNYKIEDIKVTVDMDIYISRQILGGRTKEDIVNMLVGDKIVTNVQAATELINNTEINLSFAKDVIKNKTNKEQILKYFSEKEYSKEAMSLCLAYIDWVNELINLTTRSFSFFSPIWSIVDQWSKDLDYKLITEEQMPTGVKRIYQKKNIYSLISGFSTKLEISQKGIDVYMCTYVYMPTIYRILQGFIFPEKMKLESGGIIGGLPRQMARTDVNVLLERFNQSKIQ